ncbi:MAG: TIGR00153 family protein [Thermoplasmatota archaeon]
MERDTILDNIRVPIVDTIYKSPFEGLVEHSKKIDECVVSIKKCIYAYIKCDFEKADQYSEAVRRIEHEADLIKANTRAHIPKSIFFSVSKQDFHHLLHDSDSILDYAEDVAVLLTMKRTCVPKEVAEGMKELIDKIIECVGAYQKIMSHMEDLVKVSFGGKERDLAKGLIKDIHRFEHEADIIEFDISKVLFNMSPEVLDPVSIIHLLKVIDRMGGIANKTENAGDTIRAMLAK